ncbi:DUF349 domain-containing protein [Algicola sagamiensis]|uniref:DUF349 domain-containing protein n=1 Tax=Algicola sagamiensis TaxID=163869 RepID=UPI000361F7F4|nr:DUF349 domain-containing protein [Algicola sagamiensis]
MIFRNLFKPKWKHTDEQVRLSALTTLSVSDVQEQEILKSLAEEDPSETVRLKALETLNQFESWWQASQNEPSNRLKHVASKHVQEAVLGQSEIVISKEQKQNFLESQKQTALLETIALGDQDDELRRYALKKLDKEKLYLDVFIDVTVSQEVRRFAFEQLSSIALYEKALKRLSSEDPFYSLIREELHEMKEAAEKPGRLLKALNLILAKLNALKDKTDFPVIRDSRQKLIAEWDDLKVEMNCLDTEQQATITEKYQKIRNSLDRIIAPLETQWNQAQQEAALRKEKQENKEKLETVLKVLEQQLLAASEVGRDFDQDAFRQNLQAQSSLASQLVLDKDIQVKLVKKIENLFSLLGQMPLVLEKISEAKQLIRSFSEKAVPETIEQLNEHYADFMAWKKQWYKNEKELPLSLPEDLKSEFKDIVSAWESSAQPLLEMQDKSFQQTRRKLGELKRLLSSGKYKSAFGLYRKLTFWYKDLNEKHRQRLQKDWQTVEEQIKDLSDWQEYISTPRKHSLVEEMSQLAEEPMDDPEEQARKIRYTREVWNSLGRSESEQDKELNDAFNAASEKAFQICREYYAQKEKDRACNLEAKQKICAELELLQSQLNDEQAQWGKIESRMSHLSREWKGIGPVDREHVKSLRQRFQSAITPLKVAIQSQQSENKAVKKDLVNRAVALAEHDDVFEAVELLKSLQTDWRKVSFAGHADEQKLWQAFRKANDVVFEKRDTLKASMKAEQQEKFDAFHERLNELEKGVSQVQQVQEQHTHQEAIQAFIQDAQATLGKGSNRFVKRANTLLDKLDKHVRAFEQAETGRCYQTLFNTIGAYIHGANESEAFHSDVIIADWLTETGHSRHDLTLMLEILSDIESPEEDKPHRMAVQMDMLANKHNRGTVDQQDELLKQWISAGAFVESDAPLLERVKVIFLS